MSAMGRNNFNWLLSQRQKTLHLIKSAGAFVLRVNDHREGGDFAPHRPIECIGQQEAAVALALMTMVDRQPAEQRRWHARITGQPTGYSFR